MTPLTFLGPRRLNAMQRTITDIDIAGKRVLMRVDFNVPLRDGKIANDQRIRAALPTIEHCVHAGAKLVLMTHVGRPDGKRPPELSTGHLVHRLRELLPKVNFSGSDEIVGDAVSKRIGEMACGEVLLLENLRFDAGEKRADKSFACQLRKLGDVYVNDAFAACHRKHASTFAVPQLFPEHDRSIGLLVQREIEALERLLESPREPVIGILGGAKVADKLGVIEKLLDRVDRLLLGGRMAYTLLSAAGTQVGASAVEEDQLDLLRRVLEKGGDRILLPIDHVIADHPDSTSQTQCAQGNIPVGWHGMDVGPITLRCYCKALQQAGTIVWNGPLGKFEDPRFRHGTETIARILANLGAFTVVGGGQTLEAIDMFDLGRQINHVSTGGGAFLKYLEIGTLPALDVIPSKERATTGSPT